VFVVAGTGIATVDGERIELRKSTLLWIRRGEVHEVRNTGKTPLKTLNIYVPPAYTSAGDELPAGPRKKDDGHPSCRLEFASDVL
jgi:mannose-6-phosphate isomerase-like protein (cupin superfamily)